MDTAFLIISLFFPRIALFIGYFFAGWIPVNPVPFWGDVMMSILIPRILIIVYIASTLGIKSGWFWIHLIFALSVYLIELTRVFSD